MKEINLRISDLQQQWGDALQAATNDAAVWVDSEEELAGLSGAQGAGRIGCPPIFAEPSAVCNLSPHLLPSFITKKGQRVCADPNNEGVQKCKSELRLGSAVEDLRSLLVERKRLDRAPSSPSLLPHRPHWRAVA